jgi:hypothetical protein
MPIIQVLLEVPQEILARLASGEYVRDAAGIIRWAKGTEKAGEIVVHLKEISQTGWEVAQPVGPNLFFPMGALAAIQLAGFIYLGYQLKQIRQAIESLRQDVKNILTQVDIMREQQWLDRLSRVAHGVEHLIDSQFRPSLLEEARNSFREARGEIKLFLDNQEPRVLVEYLPQAEQLTKGLCVGFAGEYVCLQRQRAEFSEMAHVCDRYSNILSETGQNLSNTPNIARIVPSQRYLANYSRLVPLRQELAIAQKGIASEKEFVTALDGIGREQVSTSRDAVPPDTNKAVMVVYP